MTFDAEEAIAKIDIWQAPCGCWNSQRPSRRPWFYKPHWGFYRWTPVWLGGDEYCRRTLVIGWEITGQIIIPLWQCKGGPDDEDDDDWCGCGPGQFDHSNGAGEPYVQMGLALHERANEYLRMATEKKYREWEERDPLDSP